MATCLEYVNKDYYYYQKGKSILNVIHHEDFDHDNRDFIKDYFINHMFLD